MRGRPRKVRGSGSVWKRKDGDYGASATVMVGGAPRRVTITRSTREAALAELRRLQGAGGVAGKGSFGQFLDQWLVEVKNSVRAKTFESYESTVRLHLKPPCGHVPLRKLEPRHIAEAIANATRATRERTGIAAKRGRTADEPLPAAPEPLSSSSRAYVRTVARIALERALKLGLVAQNVAKMTIPVRVERAELRTMRDEEFRKYLDAIAGNRLEAAFLLAALMGMRKGEILGLSWDDVVEAEGRTVLYVRHQVQRVAKQLRVVRVKTDKSRRAIVLGEGLAELLRRRRVLQKAERLRAGALWEGSNHVFTTRTGGLIEPRNMLEYHYARLAKAGLPKRSFHAMRHEAATAMLAAGVPLKGISATLGHSSERFTSETYAHMVPSIEAQVTAAAEARMKKR